MKKLLVLGSTGMIGSRIVAEARRRGHHVTEATRSGGDGRIALDASNTEALSAAAAGHDAIISAISPPRDGGDPAQPLLASGQSIMAAARTADVHRVFIVGGAGSLLLPDRTRVVDQDWFPAEVRPEALAQAELLDLWRDEADDLEWSYLSPAGHIEPGERTDHFTLGLDTVVANSEGNSNISAEDFAVAVINEIEHPTHLRQRFTLGYS